VIYRYTRVSDKSEYERIFACPPLFNQPCNCIVFSLADLQAPVIGYNKELNSIFKNLLDVEIKKQSQSATFTSEVRQMILKHFQFNFFSSVGVPAPPPNV
jgi:hypothetical protein